MTLRKFYKHHHEFVDLYDVSVANLIYLLYVFMRVFVLYFCYVVLSFWWYFLTLSYKRQVWLALKQGSNPDMFFYLNVLYRNMTVVIQ